MITRYGVSLHAYVSDIRVREFGVSRRLNNTEGWGSLILALILGYVNKLEFKPVVQELQ